MKNAEKRNRPDCCFLCSGRPEFICKTAGIKFAYALVIISRKEKFKRYILRLQKENKEDLYMSAIIVNQENFNEIVNSGKKVLLDFWAPWCGPCRMVLPLVEEIASERSDILVGKINVDEQPELASKFGVMSIPTLVVLEGGKIVNQSVGAKNKNAILNML